MTRPSDDPTDPTDPSDGPAGAVAGGFRLGYVPGATPAKWVRTWRDRYPATPLDLVPVTPDQAGDLLRAGALDAALLRLPTDRDGLHVVPLYEEVAVVVVSRDHDLAALDDDETVAPGDLADEVVLQPADDVLDWAETPGGAAPGNPPVEVPTTTGLAIELVAAGVGVVVVPQSLARLHHRKDVTYRLLDGGPVAPVALAWSRDHEDGDGPGVDDFVGIVRGRTANSSRGRRAGDEDSPAAPGGRGGADQGRRGGADRGQDRGQGGASGRPAAGGRGGARGGRGQGAGGRGSGGRGRPGSPGRGASGGRRGR